VVELVETTTFSVNGHFFGGVAGVSPAEGVGGNGEAIVAEGETSPFAA